MWGEPSYHLEFCKIILIGSVKLRGEIGQRVGENSHDEFVLSRKRICPLCFLYYFDIFAYPIMGHSFEILLTLLLLSNLKGKQ